MNHPARLLPRCRVSCALFAMLGLAVIAGAARGDDWPQFRRDSSRTGASSDPVKLPLTEIWSWNSMVGDGPTPLYHSVIAGDRILFTAFREGIRYLVCAEAKTGAIHWMRPLVSPRLSVPMTDSVGPAVLSGAIIFVYDELPLFQLASTRKHRSIENAIGENAFIPEALWRKQIGDMLDAARFSFGYGRDAGPEARRGIPPGVSASIGRDVVALDSQVRFRRGPAGTNKELRYHSSLHLAFRRFPTFCVRTFDMQGRPGTMLPLPRARMNDSLRRLLLLHPPQTHQALRMPVFRSVGGGGSSEALGHPLLAGGELVATSLYDLFVRWKPFKSPNDSRSLNTLAERQLESLKGLHLDGDDSGRSRERPSADNHAAPDTLFPARELSALIETLVHHPLPGAEIKADAGALFGGSPPVASPGGYLVGEDSSHRFLTSIDAPAASWHRDVRNTLGIPAVANGRLFVGMGGVGASRGIVALDASTSAPAWTYAPHGLPEDPIKMARIPQIDESGGHAPPIGVARSPLPPGHWTNSGLVVSKGRVFGEAGGTVVSLDQTTGAVKWVYPLDPGWTVRSITASADHLLLSLTSGSARLPLWQPRRYKGNALAALNLEDGKLAWQENVPRDGNLSLSAGMVFLADGALRAYAPAERTFRLAVDSPERSDYAVKAPAAKEDPCTAPAQQEAGKGPAPPAERGTGVAEATVVRLQWGKPLPEMLAAIRARRAAAPGVPLLLSLDPLNGSRSGLIDSGVPSPLTSEGRKVYAKVCAQLAGGTRPAHFDVLPEFNVYLARYPEKLPQVRALVEAVVREVHVASSDTRVTASLNCEVASRFYGRGQYQPFGKIDLPGSAALAGALRVAELMDEVGLTSHPQAGFARSDGVSPDYLLSFKRMLAPRPVLVTSVSIDVKEKASDGPLRQTEFLRRILQACYWLDAPVVAYPALTVETPGDREAHLALRVGKQPRPALQVWQDVSRWELVDRLTLSPPGRAAAP